MFTIRSDWMCGPGMDDAVILFRFKASSHFDVVAYS